MSEQLWTVHSQKLILHTQEDSKEDQMNLERLCLGIDIGDKMAINGIKTKEEGKMYILNLKSRVAKNNAIIWFIKNKGWYL